MFQFQIPRNREIQKIVGLSQLIYNVFSQKSFKELSEDNVI